MKVKLINTDGISRQAIIKSFVGAKNLICENTEGDCYLEHLTLSDGSILLFDEEGKFKNLSVNEKATVLALESNSIFPSDCIVGNVILIEKPTEFDELPYDL